MKARFLLALSVSVLLALPSIAEERTGPVGRMSVSSAAVEWQAAGSNFERLVLVVATPDGATITREFQGSRASFRLADLAPRVVADGTYMFELRAMPKIAPEVKQRLAAARAADDEAAVGKIRAEAGIGEPVVQAGAFAVRNGSFVADVTEAAFTGPKMPKVSANAAGPGKLNPGTNDVVTADDAIIQGSLCVGLDCVNNESFGFDTIRLKENNTRIKFDDTSTTAGCPNNDWQLTANDACGGANKFSIEDITGSKVPFTITAGAPTNSVFVASSGKVGFGNSSPGLNLHITATDTPAIRQEQTNGGGFTAQTWDIGANEANWFVRDLTGGSRLPFRIRPGAPTSSIDIAADGKVGIGTASPETNLHVFSSSTNDAFVALGEDPDGSTGTQSSFNVGYGGASLGRGGAFLNVRPDSNAVAPNPSLRFLTVNVLRMIITNTGNVGFGGITSPTNPIQHNNGAFLSSGGVWTNASSRSLKQDIRDLATDDAMEALKALQPVRFAYKADPKETHVGFIAEDVPALVATQDRKSLSPMDVVAVLTKVVQQQENTIEELKARIDQLEKKQ
jgi:Chaperone of endosialidase